MNDHLAHFGGDVPGKSQSAKQFRVHAELMSKANLYHARMLELKSEGGHQPVGSPGNDVEKE